MGLRSRQKGLGWFGLLFVLGTLGVFAIVTVKSFPVYMNQMKIARAVKRVATDPEAASGEANQVHRALSRYWDIDNIDTLGWADVKIKRTERGRFLSYDYEVRVPLFYNVSLLYSFKGDELMQGGRGAGD